MRLEIVAYKLPEGIWAFDHDHEDTVCEALLNGTELVIDAHYKRIKGVDAVEDDTLQIVLATEPQDDLGDPDTELDKDDSDHYFERELGMPVWLCPWLEGYFGNRPENLLIWIEPENVPKS